MLEKFRKDRGQEHWDTAQQGGIAVTDREGADQGVVDRDRPATETVSGRPLATDRDGVVDRPTMAAQRERQRAEFGGFNWGAAFFGWLVAVGLGALLAALLGATGVALGLGEVSSAEANSNAETIGLGGAIALLVVMFIAYYAGGYVAGRMSRFDGARQGFGVWVIALFVAAVLAVAGAIAGAEYNLLGRLDLPRIPVDEGDVTTAGLIALAIAVLGTLVAAVVGGKAGEQYHRRVDRAAVLER